MEGENMNQEYAALIGTRWNVGMRPCAVSAICTAREARAGGRALSARAAADDDTVVLWETGWDPVSVLFDGTYERADSGAQPSHPCPQNGRVEVDQRWEVPDIGVCKVIEVGARLMRMDWETGRFAEDESLRHDCAPLDWLSRNKGKLLAPSKQEAPAQPGVRVPQVWDVWRMKPGMWKAGEEVTLQANMEGGPPFRAVAADGSSFPMTNVYPVAEFVSSASGGRWDRVTCPGCGQTTGAGMWFRSNTGVSYCAERCYRDNVKKREPGSALGQGEGKAQESPPIPPGKQHDFGNPYLVAYRNGPRLCVDCGGTRDGASPPCTPDPNWRTNYESMLFQGMFDNVKEPTDPTPAFTPGDLGAYCRDARTWRRGQW